MFSLMSISLDIGTELSKSFNSIKKCFYMYVLCNSIRNFHHIMQAMIGCAAILDVNTGISEGECT